jgi:hypothetical protein
MHTLLWIEADRLEGTVERCAWGLAIIEPDGAVRGKFAGAALFSLADGIARR